MAVLDLPLELLLLILDYEATGDNEAVLVSNATKKWRAVISEWRLRKKTLGVFQLTIRGFVSSIPLVQWARKASGYRKFGKTCFRTAVITGNLEVIKWLEEQGGRWSYREMCEVAARYGHLEVLKWIVSQMDSSRWIGFAGSSAAEGGHIHILEWLYQQKYKPDYSECTSAAKNGHLNVIKWLRERGRNWSNLTWDEAAKHGHLDILKYMQDQGYSPPEEFACSAAVAGGQLEILKWLVEQGYSYNKSLSAICAAEKGYIHILEWLRVQGCVWNDFTYYAASDNPEVTAWLKANP